MRILVVDDEPVGRAYLAAVFEHRGDTVAGAADGVAALEEIARDRPDVVISDVLMPGMDGYRLCRAIREDPEIADLPFVFYTATYTEPRDEQLAGDLGADLFAVKPKGPDEITRIVDQAVALRAQGATPTSPTDDSAEEYDEVILRKLEQTVTKLEIANHDLARYQLMFQQSPDPIFFLTRDMTVLEANPAAAARYGYSQELLTGLDFHALRGPDVEVRADEMLYQAERRPVVYESEGISSNGTTFPVEVRVRAVSLGGESVLVAITRDLTDQKRQEDELRSMIDELERLAYSTVDAFGKVVEQRDPYTGGHQERVADLAANVGERLGLSAARCRSLRMAGLVHDVGKIGVPTEILNKPGRLSRLEFELVKTHAQLSYDILSQIKFPWPIAEMALQHHERVNGSGYPQGLSGDEIMLEARILAVADVIEAMTFHRPYKTVLGLDRAIQEIIDNAGVLYDADVADAVVKLFTEDGYVFPPITQSTSVSQPACATVLPGAAERSSQAAAVPVGPARRTAM
jgi:PAS domain S-box-containing protein